ncbi:carbohydrate ABC transporter permease [Streptomyces violaceusniger]|uniref:carbohydrate ABC transporter permease n=1 Tax=Streptomyces violaceusniger TaxID=68280 RepID=UPI0009C39E97|nr:sugar ABC transporter permease [Streptomyces hygroscopicus]AQW56037.1 binding-protein-dependent transporter [Streptomyces hygroscopicus]
MAIAEKGAAVCRAAPVIPAPRRRSPWPALRHFVGFGLPGLLVYACFVLAPILLSVGYSFTNADQFKPHTRFIGFDNYVNLLTDDAFLTALKVTTILTLIVVIVPNVLGLAVALLLDRRGWLYNALRGVFFVPVVLSSVVVSVIWQAMLTDDGLINTTLRSLGVAHPPGWLSDPQLALYSIGFIISWQMLGFCAVVYLAGLQGVPQELHEAASIDGAGALLRFRKVTWPMLAPALTINTVMLLITGFKTYDHIQVLTNGGPGTGTTATLAFSVAQTGFTANRTGEASAMALIMLVIVAIVSTVALRFLQRREVHL